MRCSATRFAAATTSAVLALAACSSGAERPAPDPSTAAAGSSSERSTSPSASAPTPPAYQASIRRIGPELRDRMRFTHRPGCPVPLSQLRHLRMSYVGFDGAVHTGEMVVRAEHAQAVTRVFEALYDARWPVRRMRLVDEYGGDDDRSMAANNTSAYNCRQVSGTSRWSEHAYGAAIDVNPVQNPYVTATSVAPPEGLRFAAVDRTSGARTPAGVIRDGDVVVRAFAAVGWEWGGHWSSSKDYQHFSASGS
jgi:hypothetical protein